MTETGLHGPANVKTIGCTPSSTTRIKRSSMSALAFRFSKHCPNPPTCCPSPNHSPKTLPSSKTPTVTPGLRIT